jgi:hypothetical protein
MHHRVIFHLVGIGMIVSSLITLGYWHSAMGIDLKTWEDDVKFVPLYVIIASIVFFVIASIIYYKKEGNDWDFHWSDLLRQD